MVLNKAVPAPSQALHTALRVLFLAKIMLRQIPTEQPPSTTHIIDEFRLLLDIDQLRLILDWRDRRHNSGNMPTSNLSRRIHRWLEQEWLQRAIAVIMAKTTTPANTRGGAELKLRRWI